MKQKTTTKKQVNKRPPILAKMVEFCKAGCDDDCTKERIQAAVILLQQYHYDMYLKFIRIAKKDFPELFHDD